MFKSTPAISLLACLVLAGGCSEQKPAGAGAGLPRAACKLKDPDIADRYQGGCKDGLAHGHGIAEGRDRYEGEFVRGEAHGQGVYVWGPTSAWAGQRYEGSQYRGERIGFGMLQVPGKPEVRGLWVRGALGMSCPDPASCLSGDAKLDMGIAKWEEQDTVFTMALARGLLRKAFAQLLDESAAVSACIESEVLADLVNPAPGHSFISAKEIGKALQSYEGALQFTALFTYCSSEAAAGPVPVRPPLPQFQPVSLDDLSVDLRALPDHDRIEVKGELIVLAGVVMLRRNPLDPNPMWVKEDALDRDARRRLRGECASNPAIGCRVTLQAEIGTVTGQRGLIARNVQFSSPAGSVQL